MENNFPIKEIQAHFKQVLDRAPGELAIDAVKFFVRSFAKQGWQGESFEPWDVRKVNNKKNKGKAILINTGRLRRSIRVVSSDTTQATIGSSVPYAKIQNEGGVIHQGARSELFVRNRYSKGSKKGSFKKGVKAGHGLTFGERNITIPKRQFMGESPVLTAQLKSSLEKKLLTGIPNS